jgi:asparagine synthase (glutamine-hydrolysing)
MCGIAGILSLEQGFDATVPLRKMQQAVCHRGPDDAGLWSQRDGLAHFAHHRLSILDLSAAGHQPMSVADGRFTIAYNGEIYNFTALRSGLEREGVAFRTRSDTEVILRLYERHGADCVKLLRGMFAFALWDDQAHSCLLARDRFGIKPLYFARQGSRLLFASELRTILASGLVERAADSHSLSRYFQTGSVPEPLTMANGVQMLESGCLLQWKDGKSQPRRWWHLAFPSPTPSITAVSAAALTRAALLDSVEHHFVSDVPVGIFLSGGIDSTALLALAHATGRTNIRTFSVGIDNSSADESALARRTAAHFGTRHEELRLTADSARELFSRFLHAVDQPTIDGFNTYCVSQLARQHGMKVVLSGLGGDELFGGYPSFQKLPMLWKSSRLLGSWCGQAGSWLQQLSSRPQLHRLADALAQGGSEASVYDAFRGVFSGADARKLAQWLTNSQPFIESPDVDGQNDPDPRNRVSALEMRRYMLNQLLRDSDVMSMAHGLELRVPFIDSALFDVVSRVPADIRLRRGKQLLLDAVPEIPEWIRRRPKRGFLFPYEQWLATSEWQAMFADALRGIPVPAATWYQRWAVFVLRHWQSVWASPPPSPSAQTAVA